MFTWCFERTNNSFAILISPVLGMKATWLAALLFLLDTSFNYEKNENFYFVENLLYSQS